MQPKVTVNTLNLQRKLAKAAKLGTPQQQVPIVKGALLVVISDAVLNLKKNGNWITGTLAGSITQEVKIIDNKVRGRVGTNLIYAPRIEFGFIGKDSLGRVYNQLPSPFLRPAFIDNLENIVNKIHDDLLIIVTNVVR